MKRTIKSFTLIELLVVIVIIGILAGVIIVSTTTSITSAKNAKMVAELSNLSKAFEGYSHYYVGSLCIEDASSNANFLSYYSLTTVPKHNDYVVGQTALTTNNCYLYFSDGENYSIRTPSVGNKGYLIQESRHPQTKPIQKTCDTGWIPFGNRCVMQYEAKCSNAGVDATANQGYPWASCVAASGIAVSTADGEPIVMIDQAQAKVACESIGAHLITNAEWMALARDIEQVASNWTGGSVGSGVLKRGNVGDTATGDYDGANPEYGTGRNSLAMLTLSNGQEIWDLSGNINEWVDDKISCNTTVCSSNLMPYGTTSGSEWCEYSSGSTSGLDVILTWGQYDKSQLTSLENYTSNNGIGNIYTDYNAASGSPDIYTHAFFRGGYWANGSNAGIFLLNVSMSPSYLSNGGGFRCVK